MDVFPLDVAPDWGFSDDPTADIEEQVLGDGYVLRRPKGINYIRGSWSPSWGHLTKQEANDTFLWLRERLQLTAFLWTHPETQEQHKVICTKVVRTSSEYNNYSLKVTLTEDFNL